METWMNEHDAKTANAVLKELQQNGQLRVTEYWTNEEKKEKNV